MTNPFAARRLGRGRRRFRAVPATIGMAWLLTGTSCLLITDRTKDQCATTEDCRNKGAPFAGNQCVQGVCISTDAAVGKCSGNADCLASPDAPNTYCSADGQCLPILDSNCTRVVTVDGKAITPESILIGVLAPLTGDNAPEGEARVNAVKLAHSEFSERAVGITAGPGSTPRPIALVVCDQVADAEGAARHLVSQVRVPAIIGPGFSGTTVKVAKGVTIPAGTLLMTPSATTPDLTTVQDNGLVWRTSSSFEPESKAYADVVAQMELNPSVRTSLELEATAPIKLAILAKGDSYGKGLADLLTGTLRFNGAGAVANGSAYFARFDLPDLTANPNADTQAVISGIVQNFKPNVLLVIGTAEVITKGLEPIEEQWITGTGAPARPFYVFSEGAKLSQLASSVANSVAMHPDRHLASRVQTFGPRYNDSLHEALRSRYSAANNQVPMPDAYGVTGSYDAFYLLAYAMLASQSADLTGTRIAEGLKHTVPPGLVISAGPTDVSKAIAELSAGRNIDYDGVTGKLDFDVTTGESPGDYNVYCVQGTEFVHSGQYYDSAASQLVGAYAPCL